ncbi:MAG: signal peptidase I [Myxococcota bacterium]|nr:signal peptidase I [Myxococcota bacterium]
MIPGLGQLRNGSLGRALTFFALPFLAAVLLFVLVVGLRPPVWTVMTAYGVIRLGVAADAWLGAPRTAISGSRAFHIVRLLMASIVGFTATVAYIYWRGSTVWCLDQVRGKSMADALVDGDEPLRFIAAYRLWIPWTGEHMDTGSIQRKDIIAAKDPLTGVQIVKRVIGIPGDEVVVRGHRAWVNGEALDEDYIKLESPEAEGPRIDNLRPDFGPIRVPKNRLFVLGDNRNGSTDSRVFGFVFIDDVKGRYIMRAFDSPNGDPNRDRDLMRR